MNYLKFSKLPLADRLMESRHVLDKYPNRIPVIVSTGDGIEKKIDKYKYLVPNTLTLGEFQFILSKKFYITHGDALFYLVNNNIFPLSTSMQNLYLKEKDSDNFLKIHVVKENTFGFR